MADLRLSRRYQDGDTKDAPCVVLNFISGYIPCHYSAWMVPQLPPTPVLRQDRGGAGAGE